MKQNTKQVFGAIAIAFILNALLGMKSFAAGNSISTAEAMSLGTVKSGNLTSRSDYYKFTVSDTGKYQISGTTNISLDAELCLINPNGGKITSPKPTWNNQNSTGTWNYSRWLSQGTYYLEVYEWDDRGSYSISVREAESANETFPSTYGMTENTGTADVISLGSTINGTLTTENNSDYYKFTVSDTGKYLISGTTTVSSDTELHLLNPSGNQIARAKPTWNSQTSNGTWSYIEELSAGTYYLKVYDYNNRGSYSISVNKYNGSNDSENIDTSMKKPSVKKMTANKKSVKVEWKKISSGITGYEIQYSTDKKFKSNKTKSVTIKKKKTVSKEIKKLKRHTKYYVRIRAYKKSGSKVTYSKWSKTKSVRTK